MIIDGHRHIVGGHEPILQEMDALGIAKTVLVGIGVRDLGPVTINDSVIFRSHFLFKTLGMLKARRLVTSDRFRKNLLGEPRNDETLAALEQRPDRFAGFAFINPESHGALEELKRCLMRGMQGIKLALVQYPSDLRGNNIVRLCEMAECFNLPVFMHLGLTEATSQPDWLVRAFPGVPFIIAHAGVQRFEETIELACRHEKVFVDTSSYIATTAKIRILCTRLSSGKLIFGSDIPVMCRSGREALAKIDALNIPDSEKAKILGENLQNMLQQTKPYS